MDKKDGKRSNNFKIYRWDSILPEKLGYSVPMIYIKPTTNLLMYGQKMNYCLSVKINCPGTVYDNETMRATLDSLVLGPNCVLPAFQDKEFYTLTLDSYFYEYPVEMGTVEILGMLEEKVVEGFCGENNDTKRDVENVIKNIEVPYRDISPGSLPKKVGMDTNSLIFLVTFIFLVSLIIFLIYQNLRK